MRLPTETGAATLIQLTIMLLLNFVTALASIISSCTKHDSCSTGIVFSLLSLIILAVWLLFLSAVGYHAQNTHNRRFATILIAGEALVAIVTLANIKRSGNPLDLITSIIDCALAIWVITLAYRLRRAPAGARLREANGGRIATPRTNSRPRQRIKH